MFYVQSPGLSVPTTTCRFWKFEMDNTTIVHLVVLIKSEVTCDDSAPPPPQRTLEREIRGCQHLILWTDGDREGEGIADEIVQVITQGIHRRSHSVWKGSTI